MVRSSPWSIPVYSPIQSNPVQSSLFTLVDVKLRLTVTRVHSSPQSTPVTLIHNTLRSIFVTNARCHACSIKTFSLSMVHSGPLSTLVLDRPQFTPVYGLLQFTPVHGPVYSSNRIWQQNRFRNCQRNQARMHSVNMMFNLYAERIM